MHIRVKITRDGSSRIELLEMEEYLRGVVPSEIKAESCPAEAMKAQAVAAPASPTTWTIRRVVRPTAPVRAMPAATRLSRPRAGRC